jgi:hypothetical protein
MAYTHEQGRKFWQAFDDHFKYKARQNGLLQRYDDMGGYNQPAIQWGSAREAGNFPKAFRDYALSVQETVAFLANEQKGFFSRFFDLNSGDVVLAFRDFAFGILASPDDPERRRHREPVHIMNGAGSAPDFYSWHGFIEAAIVLETDAAFWTQLRWINGISWELSAKARPQKVSPNRNEPLPAAVTTAIRDKWAARTDAQIGIEFDNYLTRPDEWLMADLQRVA